MIGKYRLTRLEDVDGKVNFSHTRIGKRFPLVLVSFDWEKLRKKASELKIGESIIIDYDK